MATQQARTQSNPQVVIERVQAAQNQHDLEAFLECIDPDYQSEQPIHPDRAFSGRAQVRKNWSTVFSSVPDFRAELLRAATAGDTSWAEWHWSGTHADGTRMEMMGVTIFGIRDNRIVWGRLYMEPVEQTGAGIDAAMEHWAHKDT